MRKLFLSIILIATAFANTDFTLLPRETEYTRPFFERYPQYNGKDVTIFIMDTGVELDLPGLRKNPDGSTKVVDVYDASRSGDVKYVSAKKEEVDGKTYLTDKEDIFLTGFEKFELENKDVYIGALKEETYLNGQAHDINGNKDSNDKWGFIAYQDESAEWTLIMDKNMDGDLSDEKPVHKYRKNYNYITIPSKNPLYHHQWMALAVNFYPKRDVVNFHFDDGAHGTHVAGIAAGYHINGDKDINGLAPAAKIVSIKIGNGAAPGSATVTGSKKRGLEFIENYMKENPGYGVINLSFGIAASNEGFSEADQLFNNFAKNNPNIIVCTSAGNEGPGLSSIGTPAAGQFLISSGAVMYHTTARDQYGWDIDSPRITSFSSRGGETAKPDVLSPGAMMSTIPQWASGNFYWGTSMASPYTAGQIACVLSGLQQNYEKKVSSALVQHGLRESSQPLKDYPILDQGYGMVDMLKLYQWLADEIDSKEPLHYNIATETFVPTLPKRKSNSLFWRIYDIDHIKDECEVDIKAVFADNIYQKELDEFFIKYRVKSDSRWAKPAQRNITILSEEDVSLKIDLNPGDIEANSFQTAKISLTPDNEYQEIGQEFWVTAINPIHFTKNNDFSYSITDKKVKPGHTNRFFLAVPYGASAMNVKFKADENEYSSVSFYLFDKDGHEAGRVPSISTENELYEVEKRFTDLDAGVLELIAYGNLSAEQISEYDLYVSFDGIQFDDEEMKKLKFNGGANPIFTGEVTPVLESYENVILKGIVRGYANQENLSFGDSDTLTIPFSKNENDKTVEFKLFMPLKYHTNFTDLVILAENNEGKFVHSSIISAKGNTFTLPASLPAGSYTLKIMVAYADYVEKEHFTLPIEEIHVFPKSYSGTYNFPGNTLYKGLNYEYSISLSEAPPMIPDNNYYVGELNILKRNQEISTREVSLER